MIIYVVINNQCVMTGVSWVTLPSEVWCLIIDNLYCSKQIDLRSVYRKLNSVILIHKPLQWIIQRRNLGFFRDKPCNSKHLCACGCLELGFERSLKMIAYENSKEPTTYGDKPVGYRGRHISGSPKRRMIQVCCTRVTHDRGLYVQDFLTKERYPMAWSSGDIWYTFIKANVRKIRLIHTHRQDGGSRCVDVTRCEWIDVDITQDVFKGFNCNYKINGYKVEDDCQQQ